MACLVGVEKRG